MSARGSPDARGRAKRLPWITPTYPLAKEPLMSIQAKTFDNGARNSESTVIELNRVVAQAEELLKTLGEEGGAAAEAVRQRVLRTVSQAKARLTEVGSRARAGSPLDRKSTRL